MIDRYKTPEVSKVLSEENKLKIWWKVELATLRAGEDLGQIPPGTTLKIRQQVGSVAKLVKRAMEIEATTGHDVQSFIDAIRERLDPDLKRYVHEYTTSTDTTEPAFPLIVWQGLQIILGATDKLAEAVKAKALQYKELEKIGRTHTQHGAPSTEGLYFLWWYDSLVRRRKLIARAGRELKVGKIRGLVGTYDEHVTPDLEARALKYLGLKPVLICGQIIMRDRFADVTNNLAILGGLLENMAVNVRLGAQTEVGEFSEPFKKGRKGSSHSPHKRNTDRSENVTGISRHVRACAGEELENIVTWWERDISHSSSERIILDGMLHSLHFMLKRMTGIITDLVVYDDQVKENLELTQGVIYSSEVKGLLMANGMDPHDAYNLTQKLSQKAWDERIDFLSLLLSSEEVPEELKTGGIQACFDLSKKLQYIPQIFARFGM
jgi:adenylosuccinate lyase